LGKQIPEVKTAHEVGLDDEVGTILDTGRVRFDNFALLGIDDPNVRDAHSQVLADFCQHACGLIFTRQDLYGEMRRMCEDRLARVVER
jgi:hypothetical protein